MKIESRVKIYTFKIINLHLNWFPRVHEENTLSRLRHYLTFFRFVQLFTTAADVRKRSKHRLQCGNAVLRNTSWKKNFRKSYILNVSPVSTPNERISLDCNFTIYSNFFFCKLVKLSIRNPIKYSIFIYSYLCVAIVFWKLTLFSSYSFGFIRTIFEQDFGWIRPFLPFCPYRNREFAKNTMRGVRCRHTTIIYFRTFVCKKELNEKNSVLAPRKPI